MVWQDNLISNMIVFFILAVLLMIVWSSITKKTMVEIMKELKEIMTPVEVVE